MSTTSLMRTNHQDTMKNMKRNILQREIFKKNKKTMILKRINCKGMQRVNIIAKKSVALIIQMRLRKILKEMSL